MPYKDPPKHSQFKPGQSGNPAGRSKGTRPFASILSERLDVLMKSDDPFTKKPKEATVQEWMIDTAIVKAVKGDLRAVEMLWRMSGEERRTINLTGEEDSPISINFQNVQDNIKAIMGFE